MLLTDWRDDLRREREFEIDLASNSEEEAAVIMAVAEFFAIERPLMEIHRTIRAMFALDSERQSTLPTGIALLLPPDLLEAIK